MSLSVDIKKKFPNFTLDMHFSLSGRRVGILGASGCGKSMTLRSIAGIFQPDEGRIVLGDRVLYDSARCVDLKPQVRNIGYLFQNYALFPNMTVRENIMAGLSGSRADKAARANEMIAKFGLRGLEERLPRQLSGGQQQMCALARIMAYRPDVILLDEPFSALDWYLRDRMQRELYDMLKDYEGMVIMVSHDKDEIYRFSEELLIVDAGHVIRHGATREVFSNPGTRSAAVLTGCKNFSRAERIDDHHVRAMEWGITIETERVLPEGIRDLGFRAHQFRPVYMRDEETLASRPPQKLKNAVRCNVVSQAQLQFERNYYIDPESRDGDGSLITWLVQRELWPMLDEKGLPDYLVMPEEDFLFLK
ncbi:MAG: ATP-binding cassette domain-containing protein [Lachnospiraceae bacterium]|nr:ATP-binding cassette domain-containing protein [Lachnospiraceae bacterium]